MADTTILGVLLNADRTKLCWQCAEIDWIVSGVQQVAQSHGAHADPIFLSRYTVGCAQVAILFRVTRIGAASDAAVDSAHSALASLPAVPETVSNFESWHSWDLQRVKVPDASALKYRQISDTVASVLEKAGCRSVVLHENGFFHALPAILAVDGTPTVTCCTDEDLVQAIDLRRRHSSQRNVTVCHRNADASSSVQALVLLIEGGKASFEKSWGALRDRWLAELQGNGPGASGVACFLIDSASAEDMHAAMERAVEMVQFAANTATTRMYVEVVETIPVWRCSRQSTFVAFRISVEECG
eukprot:m.899106 g.899106  ORF g.899106 m.899106 type:complete len:300 (-) comp23678_c0_seq2:3310-4209(-)